MPTSEDKMATTHQTLLAERLRAAGVNTTKAAVYNAAADVLRKNKRMPALALADFLDLLRDDAQEKQSLIAELIVGRALDGLRHEALVYLAMVGGDMRNRELESSGVESGGGDRKRCDSQSGVVPAAEKSDDGSSVRVLSRGEIGPSSFPKPGDQAAPPPDAGPAASNDRVPGTPIKTPASLRGAYERNPTLFDTLRLRDGTPIGDLVWSALPRYFSANLREAAVLRMIYQRARPADPNARVRDVVKIEDLQRFQQLAAEEADAAL